MITAETIRRFSLTPAAVAALEEAGMTDALVEADLHALTSPDVDCDAAALLAVCLDGADDDRVQGWRDYVNALAVVAG